MIQNAHSHYIYTQTERRGNRQTAGERERVRESEREWERVRESEREWERVRESERVQVWEHWVKKDLGVSVIKLTVGKKPTDQFLGYAGKDYHFLGNYFNGELG
jgi:hypothetical protein